MYLRPTLFANQTKQCKGISKWNSVDMSSVNQPSFPLWKDSEIMETLLQIKIAVKFQI